MKEKKGQDRRDEENGIPQMPFNEALKRVWATKPQHRAAKKKAPEKK
jgi:hypothetical protein